MSKKIFLYFIAILLLLNFFCWQEVFNLVKNGYILKVYFLDVGQGDSIFIETPQKHQILIDGGPDSIVLEKLQKIMPATDRTIDLVILTHPEKDHMQGLIEVLQRYSVDYILWTGIIRDSPEYQKWISVLAEEQNQGAKIITAEFGQAITAGGVKIDILHPFEKLVGQEMEDSNDSSVVSRLFFGENVFLFTGDITTKTEQELMEEKMELRADILKVGHHGSKYSTAIEFLENISPEFAIISSGKNSYGHPTSEVLQRLKNFGIKVLRTDLDGDIKIISDGKNIIINSLGK